VFFVEHRTDVAGTFIVALQEFLPPEKRIPFGSFVRRRERFSCV
jgi:hypothetical protein